MNYRIKLLSVKTKSQHFVPASVSEWLLEIGFLEQVGTALCVELSQYEEELFELEDVRKLKCCFEELAASIAEDNSDVVLREREDHKANSESAQKELLDVISFLKEAIDEGTQVETFW